MHAASPAVLNLPARHVPRPRLTRLLDEVSARAILITAPAGYGKTTLATEWLGSRERVAWYRATLASADLAVFSIGVAEAVTAFADHALRRVSQRLQVGDQPEHAVQPLAEVLADNLAEWPEDAWLAIDDYHLVMQSPTVDRFVATLLELAPIRLLVTSRRRPPWATARKLLYGEIAEVGPAQLAMDEFEAGQALGGRRPEAVRALVEQAEGWPALIGMAALTSSLEVPSGRVSDMLFRYFAEEVLRQEPPEVQDFMLRAAVPASFTLGSARDLLGVVQPAEVVELLKDEGLLHEYRDGALGFHPLLRGFLRSRLQAEDPEAFGAILEASVEAARADERWDEAFELASSAGRRDLMVEVTSHAARLLLSACRFETVGRWVAECEPLRSNEVNLRLARAWLLIGSGRPGEAEALLRSTLANLAPESATLSWGTRGLASTLYSQSRYEEALTAALDARDAAQTAEDLVGALWEGAMAASILESEVLDDLYAQLESVQSHEIDHVLLSANARVVRSSRSESLAGLWPLLRPLLNSAARPGPYARLSLLTAAGYVAVSRSDYETAEKIGETAVCLKRELGIERGWPLIQLCAAQLALRKFDAARDTLQELESGAERNTSLRGQVLVLRAKSALFQTGASEVLAEHDPLELAGLPNSSLGEYFGLVAIAAAANADLDLASQYAETAQRLSQTIEARYYPRFARLIARSVEEGQIDNVRRAAAGHVLDAAAAGITDAFVISYRAYPVLLRLVTHNPRAWRLVKALTTAAKDQRLTRQVRSSREPENDVQHGVSSLTKREMQVLELLVEGLSNAEIADSLVISHSTAKVHVHNILEKLGVRRRTQAVLLARHLLRKSAARREAPVRPGSGPPLD